MSPTAPSATRKVCVFIESVSRPLKASFVFLVLSIAEWLSSTKRDKKSRSGLVVNLPETKHSLITYNCASNVCVHACVCVAGSHLSSRREAKNSIQDEGQTKGKQVAANKACVGRLALEEEQ